MKRYFLTIWTLCVVLTKRWSRDPVALFFIFLFPMIFLLVFGAMSRSNSVSFNVVLLNRSDTKFAADFASQIKKNKIFKVKDDVKTFDAAKDKMGRGELDSIIELPAGFGQPNNKDVPEGKIVVYYQEASPDTGRTVASVMQQVLDGINKQLTGAIDPLTVEQKATKTTDLTRFDYTLAGIVGFSILSLTIFGMANGFPADKKTGALRRMRATPLRASQLVLATALEYLLIGLLSVALMFAVATVLFDFDMRGNYLTLAAFVLMGIFTLFGFGMAIGGWARNENQSAPLSNLVAFPMMFLSGVFFPSFLMPQWLQNISHYLPLTPVVDGIRLIITENAGLFSLGPQLAILAGWSVIIYALAFKVFRWE
jgi:ABC-2 type transport system permease protein